MADVFLARDESLGRMVAIKIPAASPGRAFVTVPARGDRGRRPPPNIVSVYDRGRRQNLIIAMEYLNGPTLKDKIARPARCRRRRRS
jgi:serine/threonine protein kinase